MQRVDVRDVIGADVAPGEHRFAGLGPGQADRLVSVSLSPAREVVVDRVLAEDAGGAADEQVTGPDGRRGRRTAGDGP